MPIYTFSTCFLLTRKRNQRNVEHCVRSNEVDYNFICISNTMMAIWPLLYDTWLITVLYQILICMPQTTLLDFKWVNTPLLLLLLEARLHPLVIDSPIINNHLQLPMWTGRTMRAPFQFVDPLISEGILHSIANCTVYSSSLDLPSSGCMQFLTLGSHPCLSHGESHGHGQQWHS